MKLLLPSKIQVYDNKGFPGSTVVKNSLARAGDTRNVGSIPGLGRSPGGGNGNPLHYSCLGNPMDRGVWRAIVHGVAKDSDMTQQLNTTTTTKMRNEKSRKYPLQALK